MYPFSAAIKRGVFKDILSLLKKWFSIRCGIRLKNSMSSLNRFPIICKKSTLFSTTQFLQILSFLSVDIIVSIILSFFSCAALRSVSEIPFLKQNGALCSDFFSLFCEGSFNVFCKINLIRFFFGKNLFPKFFKLVVSGLSDSSISSRTSLSF